MNVDKMARTSKSTGANGGEAATSLRELRHSRGYSVEDLAIATGLTTKEIEDVERLGEQAPEHHRERVRNALR